MFNLTLTSPLNITSNRTSKKCLAKRGTSGRVKRNVQEDNKHYDISVTHVMPESPINN